MGEVKIGDLVGLPPGVCSAEAEPVVVIDIVNGFLVYIDDDGNRHDRCCTVDRAILIKRNDIKDKKEGNMSVITKLKKLALNKEERLLREYGIHSDCGDLTEEGKEVLWIILEEANKEELIKKVKELDKEEKPKKKK